MNFSKQALVDAVGVMVDLDNETAQRYGQTVESMARFRTRHPDAWLGYELEVLNPLVNLAERDPDGFTRVQSLIDGKREQRGAEAIWPDPNDERFDKTEYQRILMQERRQRSRRALEIENMQRSERDKLVGSARLDFENRVIAQWGAELQKTLAEARQAASGRLNKERQAAIRERFWSSVDDRLDEEYENTRRRILRA